MVTNEGMIFFKGATTSFDELNICFIRNKGYDEDTLLPTHAWFLLTNIYLIELFYKIGVFTLSTSKSVN